MENAAGQLGFAIAAIAFAIGAICFIFLGLKELNAAMREYSESLDRDEEYQKLTYLRVNNLKSIGLFLWAAAFLLAASLALDVYRGYAFYAYIAAVILVALAVAWFSERKYKKWLKKELGLK